MDQTTKTYEVAAKYHKLGWNVIPITKHEKVPVSGLSFQEFTRAKQSETDVYDIFSEHDGNIAVLCGETSGIVVVDMDTYKEHYQELNISSPVSVKTPRGGKHLYFRYTGEKNAAEMKAVGIRSTGYYVLLPPSTTSHGAYTWDITGSLTEALAALPVLPPEVLERFKVRPEDKTETKKILEYAKLKEGEGREVAMHELACKLHNSYPWSETVELCRVFNRTYSPPLDEREFLHALEGVQDFIAKNPKTLLKQKKREEDAERAVSEKPVEESAALRTFTGEKRYTWGTPNLNDKFAVIKPGDFVVFGAKRSSGKTTFAYDMALKNATEMNHRVLFVSLEMDEQKILDDFGRKFAGITTEEEFHQLVPSFKLAAYRKRIEELKGIKNFVFAAERRSADTTWEMIVAIIKKHAGERPFDIIFIDNLDLIAGDSGERDFDRQKRITTAMMSYTSSQKIPIVLIHHYRKSGKEDHGMDELAGSGKIGDNADIVVRIKKNADPDAGYPDKYKSELMMQKGRGYREQNEDIFFIRGTFVDTPPPEIVYDSRVQTALDMLGGEVIQVPDITL